MKCNKIHPKNTSDNLCFYVPYDNHNSILDSVLTESNKNHRYDYVLFKTIGIFTQLVKISYCIYWGFGASHRIGVGLTP